MDLDETRSDKTVACNIIGSGEALAIGDGGDSETFHEILIEWEPGLEGDLVFAHVNVCDVLHDGRVLLVDVDQAEIADDVSLAISLGTRGHEREAELELLVLRLDGGGFDIERDEGVQVVVELLELLRVARAGDDVS